MHSSVGELPLLSHFLCYCWLAPLSALFRKWVLVNFGLLSLTCPSAFQSVSSSCLLAHIFYYFELSPPLCSPASKCSLLTCLLFLLSYLVSLHFSVGGWPLPSYFCYPNLSLPLHSLECEWPLLNHVLLLLLTCPSICTLQEVSDLYLLIFFCYAWLIPMLSRL
jgi:hypothetical protein